MAMSMISVQPIWGSIAKEAFLRRRFQLTERPRRAVLRIFSDTGYELFLNGRLVAVVDEWNNTRDYEVTPFLRAGENLAAVHVVNHSGHRGCSLELCCDGVVNLVSDGNWRASDCEKWGWILPEFDDRGWSGARIVPLRHAGLPQWRGHAGDHPERVIPCLQGSPFFVGEIPKAVDSPFFRMRNPAEEALPELAGIVGDGYRHSWNDRPAPLAHVVAYPQAEGVAAGAEGVFQLECSGRYEGPFFLLDFGAETVGFLRFRCASPKGARLRIRYGESLAECLAEPARDQLLHRMLIEEVMLGAGVQEYESRQRVGFRFVRIELFDTPQGAELSEFSVRASLYPVSYRGYFHCSDPLLNRIWEAGRKTLHLGMQEYYLDGVKRDRFLWVGDTRAEALYNYYLFGDQELFRFCWEEIASVQYADGAIPSAMGEGSSILWDYVAWWVIAFHDYRLFTGDDAFLLRLRQNLFAAVEWLSARAGEDGLIDIPENPMPSWMIVLNKAVGRSPYLNWIYLRALRTALEVALLADEPERILHYRALVERTEVAVEKLMRETSIFEEPGLRRSSTSLYELLELLFARGEAGEALDLIRREWGALLDTGADTLYEGFYASPGSYPVVTDPRARALYVSFCHGWTAGPCALLPAEIAGIKPLEPGFRRFRVAPNPVELAEVEAVVPTPHGEIALALNGSELRLLVPEGTTAELELPGADPLRRTLPPGVHRIAR